MNARRGCLLVSGIGWPSLVALIAVDPGVDDPLRLVFILLTVVVPVASFAVVLPSLLGDYFAAIKLGVMLHEREVGEVPAPKEPTRLRSVV